MQNVQKQITAGKRFFFFFFLYVIVWTYVKRNKNDVKAKRKIYALYRWLNANFIDRSDISGSEMRNVKIKFVECKRSEANRVRIECDRRIVCNPQSCKASAEQYVCVCMCVCLRVRVKGYKNTGSILTYKVSGVQIVRVMR